MRDYIIEIIYLFIQIILSMESIHKTLYIIIIIIIIIIIMIMIIIILNTSIIKSQKKRKNITTYRSTSHSDKSFI